MNDTNRFTRLRNGENTNTQQYNAPGNNENYAAYVNRRSNNVRADRGLHENMDYYDDCNMRMRNMGKSGMTASSSKVIASLQMACCCCCCC